jgi:hypothetical protein
MSLKQTEFTLKLKVPKICRRWLELPFEEILLDGEWDFAGDVFKPNVKIIF